MIKVAIVGANGKMGSEVVKLVLNSPELELACAIDKFNVGKKITDKIEVKEDIEKTIQTEKPDVVVDFTQPSCIFENIKLYMKLKTKAVIGTTGLSKEQIEEIEKLSKENNTGIIIAPNFSIGAILMMKFAAEASKYFSNACFAPSILPGFFVPINILIFSISPLYFIYIYNFYFLF